MARPAPKKKLVLSFSPDTPIKEIQLAAKQAGLGTIGAGYIDKVRREARGKRGRGGRKPAATTATAEAVAVPVVKGARATTAPDEDVIRMAIVVLGTARVRRILDDFETLALAHRGPAVIGAIGVRGKA